MWQKLHTGCNSISLAVQIHVVYLLLPCWVVSITSFKRYVFPAAVSGNSNVVINWLETFSTVATGHRTKSVLSFCAHVSMVESAT